MGRALPADVARQMTPMPPDFLINFEDHGHYVRWSATLTIEGQGPIEIELGYSRAGGKADEKAERMNLRESAWEVMELARLGRADLLQHCLVDRHKRSRPVSRPQIVVGPEQTK
jgi:hypothetical protein